MQSKALPQYQKRPECFWMSHSEIITLKLGPGASGSQAARLLSNLGDNHHHLLFIMICSYAAYLQKALHRERDRLL